jgi:hypothetical protein
MTVDDTTSHDKTAARCTTSVHPLFWWRSMDLGALHSSAASELSAALAGIEMFGEPRWRDARNGKPASAIGCLLDCLPTKDVTPQLDAAVSAVLLCALRGDVTAKWVLVQCQRSLAAGLLRERSASNSRTGKRAK